MRQRKAWRDIRPCVPARCLRSARARGPGPAPGYLRPRCALLLGMRNHVPDAIAAAVVATAVVAAAPAQASAALPRPVDARPQAHVEQFAPRITNALERVAFSRVSIVLGRRFRRWSVRKVGEEARKRVSEWKQHDARVCPDPLPSQYFCSSPPRPRWDLGVALEIQGYRPGEFRSPWRPSDAPPRTLIPGYMFWLTCWSPGAVIDNGLRKSNFWYRLTNSLYVSAAWLETGTNTPSVGRC